ncbi:MAG TPA: VanW family protein [Nocardioidaceae bacterium]|nr:VanW family protein [Nocardioidaceae bacterium]
MSDQPFRERNRDRSVVTWLLVGLVVLFGGLYVAGYVFTSDKVPRGTTVAGVAIGGLEPAAAERVLAREIDTDQPVVVSADGRRHRIDPVAAGLSVDPAESVAQAGAGRSWSPARMWDFFTGGDDHEPVVTVDGDKLTAEIATFAEKVDTPARDGGVRFRRGRADAQEPSTGSAIDRAAATQAVVDAYLTTDEVVPLPFEEVQPEITAEEVTAAMDDFANPAMSAPVIIELGGEDVVLRPAAYSPALSMENQGGDLVPVLDEEALLKAIEPAMKTVALQPEDATVKLVDGRPQVVRGKPGVTFDPEDITSEFLTLVVQKDEERTLAVATEVDRPDFSAKDARKLGITEVVSEFTTYFPHSDYRNTNLGRAAELINGTVLRPGETFSLNETVGERTAENGFAKGFIISDGVYREDFGGGVSQVATTTFNAAFFAGLEDVEHKPHSFYIDRYPIGREATVAWGLIDLRFKNDTPYGILIQAGIEPSTPSSSGSMTVRMWSTDYWDITAGVSERYNLTEPETRHLNGEECVPNEGYGGFDIDVFRHFRRAGEEKLVRTETMHTTYTPSDTVVCS